MASQREREEMARVREREELAREREELAREREKLEREREEMEKERERRAAEWAMSTAAVALPARCAAECCVGCWWYSRCWKRLCSFGSPHCTVPIQRHLLRSHGAGHHGMGLLQWRQEPDTPEQHDCKRQAGACRAFANAMARHWKSKARREAEAWALGLERGEVRWPAGMVGMGRPICHPQPAPWVALADRVWHYSPGAD